MKIAAVVVAFLAVVVLVSSDTCSDHGDCVAHATTHCTHSTHVACHHQECVCTDGHTGQSCAVAADCTSCPDTHNEHCVNGGCHCSQA